MADDENNEAPVAEQGAAGAEGPATRRHRRRNKLLIVLAVLVVGGLGWFVQQWVTRGAKEVKVQSQVERYREQAGSDQPAEFLRPATGVYVYQSTGSEKLSILGMNQQWGPTTPASVTRDDDDCWTLRIDYSTNHWGETQYCPDGERLLGPGHRGYQGFDFGAAVVGEVSVFTCDPPTEVIRVEAEKGDTWSATCRGASEGGTTNVVSSGANTFLGIEELTIGGTRIAAFRYREQRDLSGTQNGSGTTDNWYSVTDGLLVKSVRTNTVTSPSPIGDVVYEESGEFILTDLEPTR